MSKMTVATNLNSEDSYVIFEDIIGRIYVILRKNSPQRLCFNSSPINIKIT